MTDDTERAEFEAWAKPQGLDLERLPNGEYRWLSTRRVFAAWQARSSRDAAGHDLREAFREYRLRVEAHVPFELAAWAKERGDAIHAEMVGGRDAAKHGDVYVEARECFVCGHRGINDNSATAVACSGCGWAGPSPDEDRCPECSSVGTMSAACPECGAEYYLIASAHVTIDAALTPPHEGAEE